MSHYRDKRNPEAVHFPARMYVPVVYGALIVLMACDLFLGLVFEPSHMRRDALILALCMIPLLMLWPRRITTDQNDIRRHGLFGFGGRTIPWKNVHGVKERSEVPLLPRRLLGLTNEVIVIQGPPGSLRIRFTSRHAGQAMFLHELKRWGAPGLLQS